MGTSKWTARPPVWPENDNTESLEIIHESAPVSLVICNSAALFLNIKYCSVLGSKQSKWKVTFSNGMPYFFKIEGEIKVILWRRKASQLWAFPGKNPGNTEDINGISEILSLCSCILKQTKEPLTVTVTISGNVDSWGQKCTSTCKGHVYHGSL